MELADIIYDKLGELSISDKTPIIVMNNNTFKALLKESIYDDFKLSIKEKEHKIYIEDIRTYINNSVADFEFLFDCIENNDYFGGVINGSKENKIE